MFARPRPKNPAPQKNGARETPDALLELLRKGFVLCQDCHGPVEYGCFDPLSLVNCPHCDSHVFVPLRIKTYHLYRPLGGGGMGSVYKAVCEEYPGEFFAVKVLSRERRNDEVRRAALYREAETVALFSGIVHCEAAVEYGYADHEHFFAMEFIPGPRLDEVIATRERLDSGDALELALQLAAADAAICERGYLYRDLKPENVIVRPDRGASLIDFGLCLPKEAAAKAPADDIVEGSVYYLPPERVASLGEDERSEIYSLGMVLLHALAGRTFFTAESTADVAVKHVSAPRLPNCGEFLPKDVVHPVCDLLDAMIRKDPSQRIASFRQLIPRMKAVYQDVTGRPCRD